MTDHEANEKRLIAHEIIRQLHEAKQLGQIQLLLMWCSLSVKDIDPAAHAEWARSEAASAHDAPRTSTQ